jgi:hypothetical protein
MKKKIKIDETNGSLRLNLIPAIVICAKDRRKIQWCYQSLGIGSFKL